MNMAICSVFGQDVATMHAFHSLQIRAGDVGGAGGEETVYDDGDALLAVPTRHHADDALEVPGRDAHHLPHAELAYRFGGDDNIRRVRSLADDAEVAHLLIRHDQRFATSVTPCADVAAVEPQPRQVHIVVDMSLEFVVSAKGKQEIGDEGLSYDRFPVPGQPRHHPRRMESLHAMGGQILACRPLPAVCRAKDVPAAYSAVVFVSPGSMRRRKRTSGGHPCI